MANNGMLYAIIGALGVAVVGGGLYIAKQEGAFTSPTTAAVTTPAPAPSSSPAPAPAPRVVTPPPTPTPPPAVIVTPSSPHADQVGQLVRDARRAITHGDFASADRALDQAERLDARSADVIAARRDLRDAQRSTQRQDNRVDALVTQARAAIARHDYAAADRLLDQAEGIDSRDRAVQQARAELTAAQRQEPRR